MTRKKLTLDDIVNWWLEKYHNTNIKQVLIEHPDWNKEGFDSKIFYKAYQVTEEQHDEWYDWVISALAKEYHVSLETAKRNFVFEYLNCAPMIKTKNDEKNITTTTNTDS